MLCVGAWRGHAGVSCFSWAVRAVARCGRCDDISAAKESGIAAAMACEEICYTATTALKVLSSPTIPALQALQPSLLCLHSCVAAAQAASPLRERSEQWHTVAAAGAVATGNCLHHGKCFLQPPCLSVRTCQALARPVLALPPITHADCYWLEQACWFCGLL